MVRIAVGGGAGPLGRTFIEALSKTKHDIIVLSRSERQSEYSNVSYTKVDYSDIESLVTVLESNKIDTVLSAIAMDNSATSQSQLNLIAAAEKSSVTKRFIPSEYGAIATDETAAIDPYCKSYLENARALEKTNLQYCRISVGFLMDFWGMPHIKTNMSPFQWAIDIKNGIAAIPGSGNDKLSITYTYDIANVIVRLLDEPEWPALAGFVGQDVTFNQMLDWAEIATERKFDVSYDGIEKLEKGEVSPLGDLKGLEEIWALFGQLLVKGLILIPDTKDFRLNDRFPDLDVLSVEDMIKQSWGGSHA